MRFRIALAICSGLLASEIIAFTTAGMNDQTTFLIWTVPFLLVISIVWYPISRRLREQRTSFRIIESVAFGVFVGLVWGLACSILLGPWAGAFSMPFTLCWMASGIAVALTHCLPTTSSIRVTAGSVIIGTFCGIIAFGVPPIVQRLTGSRTVQSVFVEYEHGAEPLKVKDENFAVPFILEKEYFTGPSLSESDLTILRRRYSRGLLEVIGGGRSGQGPEIRLIFVMQRHLNSPVQFALPKKGTVIYMQTDSGWQTEPPSYAQLDRAIELTDVMYESDGSIYHSTHYMIENSDGGRTGGEAFSDH